ncbi:MAG: sel1 repeat family protein [Deltaproteobacteria bacterium]|nr:MAG: sel1 repeat family protein [Deltaproteobacteria bacterium]
MQKLILGSCILLVCGLAPQALHAQALSCKAVGLHQARVVAGTTTSLVNVLARGFTKLCQQEKWPNSRKQCVLRARTKGHLEACTNGTTPTRRCAAVAAHQAKLLAEATPSLRKSIQKSLYALCQKEGWSEKRATCLLRASTLKDLKACKSSQGATPSENSPDEKTTQPQRILQPRKLAPSCPSFYRRHPTACSLWLGCNNNDGKSCFKLGWLFEGKKLTRRPKNWRGQKALGLYLKSCRLGYANACTRAGTLFSMGYYGIRKDQRRSKRLKQRWFQLVEAQCRNRNAKACIRLGKAYYIGGWYNRTQPRKARRYFFRAVALGDPEGYTRIGYTYWYGVARRSGARIKQKPFLARKYFAKACQRNHILGCAALGGTYGRYNQKLPRNYRLNRYYLNKACELGGGNHCWHLAVIYKFGRGTRRNCTVARKYARAACRLNRKLCGRFRCP